MQKEPMNGKQSNGRGNAKILEIRSALAQSQIDLVAGRVVQESAVAHMERLEGMLKTLPETDTAKQS
jgi:hypothetical protein